MKEPHASADPAGRFLALLRPIEGELEGYCRRLVWDPQEAGDALHNALARAIGAFDRYQEGTNFRAWMFMILTREAFAVNRKHLRIAAREFQMAPDAMEALAQAAPREWDSATAGSEEQVCEELDERLVWALKTLTEEERAVLLLRAMGGFNYLEIAKTLDMPVGSVIGYLGRARRKARLALAREMSSGSMKGIL
jgi:RNA polymerase sigma-70 factor, ECF subfamily